MCATANQASQRLAEAILVPRLYEALTGASDPARAMRLSGLMKLLYRDPQFIEAATCLLDGNPKWPRLWSQIVTRLPTEGHHHLALLYTRMGWDELEKDPSAATRHFVAAQERFGVVLDDETYLDGFFITCGHPLPEEPSAELLTRWILSSHGEAIVAVMKTPGTFDVRQAAPHWHALSAAERKLGPHAAAEAGLWQDRIVNRALEIVDELGQGIEPLEAKNEEMTLPFTSLRRITTGIGLHEALSTWALERAVRWAWPLYKTRALDRLGVLMGAVRPFGLHVEELLLREEGAFGRQSICADFLLFLADNAEFEEEEALFRRGLAVCPEHRNSRLMLSYHILRHANDSLTKAEDAKSHFLRNEAHQRECLSAATVLVDDAESLFPTNPKIEDYRRRIAEVSAQLSE
jgi:hypothetical protein